MRAIVDGDADDVLVVRERVDRRGVRAADVFDLPLRRDRDAVERGDVRDDGAGDGRDAAGAEGLHHRREERVAVVGPAAAERGIAAAANHEVVAVEEDVRAELPLEA